MPGSRQETARAPLKASVILRSYNRLPATCDALERLLRQDYASFEVVVLEQSTRFQPENRRRLLELAARDARARVFFSPPLGGPASRNEGVRRSTGDVVIFLDDDDLPAGDGWISAHLRNYQDPLCLAVSGRHLVPGGREPPYRSMARARRRVLTYSPLWWQRCYVRVDRRSTAIESIHGTNSSVRRDVLARVGLWDECTEIEDESSFCYRLLGARRPGEHMVFDPDAAIIRRLDLDGGLDKRRMSAPAFGRRIFDFFHDIIAHYHTRRFLLLYPAYTVLLLLVTLEWVWSDSRRHRGLARRLWATTGFTASLPALWLAWLARWTYRRLRFGAPARAPLLLPPAEGADAIGFWRQQGDRAKNLSAVDPGTATTAYNDWKRRCLRDWAARRARQAIGNDAGPLVDLGCGFGDFTVRLATGASEVIACDASPGFVQECRTRLERAGHERVSVVHGDVREFRAFRDAAVVHVGAVMTYLDDDACIDLLRSARQRLRPGGVVLSRDWCAIGLGRPGAGRQGWFSLHRRPAAYARLAAAAGLRVVEQAASPSVYAEHLALAAAGGRPGLARVLYWPLRVVWALVAAPWTRCSVSFLMEPMKGDPMPATRLETVRVPGLRELSRAGLDGLRADLACCHPAIRGVAGIDPVEQTISLHVDDAHPAHDADVIAQAGKVVDACRRAYRFVCEHPPLWSRDPRGKPAGAGALGELVCRHTHDLGPGQVALRGPAAGLRRFFDERFRRLALELGAEEWHLPSIESTADLMPATGYLATHPHLVTFGYRLPAHFDHVRSFAAEAGARSLAWPTPGTPLEPTGFVLEPFVCHNVYRSLRGARLAGSLAVTALGNCYRHEGFRLEPLLRQWEFSMRELVLVGDAERVAHDRQRALDLTRALCEELDLGATVEVATDPFFAGTGGSPRAFQLKEVTKLEVRLRIDDARATAAASFNRHGTHFTSVVDLRDTAGALLETACVGWGLERWLAAFVARWGADPAGWPVSCA